MGAVLGRRAPGLDQEDGLSTIRTRTLSPSGTVSTARATPLLVSAAPATSPSGFSFHSGDEWLMTRVPATGAASPEPLTNAATCSPSAW